MKPLYRIEVSVLSDFMEEQSQPDGQRFVFAYHVTIRNRGLRAAQLHGRHWLIVDGNGKTDEVRGTGVVGEQPVITSGCEYRYDSYCVLETPVGVMHGHYQMVGEDGHPFEVVISPFSLAVPGSVN